LILVTHMLHNSMAFLMGTWLIDLPYVTHLPVAFNRCS
jgi:hypothetical protein